MSERIALKRLTASDLTFFDAQFQKLGVGNQKSINLNADPFSKQFYPVLASTGEEIEVPVAVTILGPSKAARYKVPRSITKKAAYKNWRLNGAAVPDPPGEVGRFDTLKPHDIAVMEFTGELRPSTITLIIVSAAADGDLQARLAEKIPEGPRRSMVAVSRAVLADLVSSKVPEDHPIRMILRDPELEAELEDAAFGSVPAVTKLRKRSGPKITTDALALAKANAQAVGADGEALAWSHLLAQKDKGVIRDVKWTSKEENAVAPWDFEVTMPQGKKIRVEVKSTSYRFEMMIHISAAELREAAEGGPRYDIWRLFNIDENGAKLRIANDIRKFAQKVLSGIDLPRGVRPDSFSVEPNTILGWGDVEEIERPDD